MSSGTNQLNPLRLTLRHRRCNSRLDVRHWDRPAGFRTALRCVVLQRVGACWCTRTTSSVTQQCADEGFIYYAVVHEPRRVVILRRLVFGG